MKNSLGGTLHAFTGHCICFVPGHLKYNINIVRLHTRRLAPAAPYKRLPFEDSEFLKQFNPVNGYGTFITQDWEALSNLYN